MYKVIYNKNFKTLGLKKVVTDAEAQNLIDYIEWFDDPRLVDKNNYVCVGAEIVPKCQDVVVADELNEHENIVESEDGEKPEIKIRRKRTRVVE
jgi:hypothetical protein